MELALQVVGLKMTGKIEDAKNVAMRIVNGSDGSEAHNGGNSSMMQLASSSTRDLRPLLFIRAGESDDFENLIVDFLAVVDVPLDQHPSNSLPTAEAFSHPTSSGQTLLHLAAFLGFSSLLTFLVKHGVDLDSRDKSGYTALHFAALSNSKECARDLLEAGADREIVNALGKTPAEMTTDLADVFNAVIEVDSDAGSEDEEAQWGDAEEDDVPVRPLSSKRTSRRILRHGNTSENGSLSITRSVDISRAVTPPPALENNQKIDSNTEAKQAASFIEMIQRTLAQLPAPQGIIPNMSQLPLPQLPNLPGIGMPAVPWGALPQIPLVFPVFVPMMPGWPSFRSGDPQAEDVNRTAGEDAATGMGAGAMRTAQEWRATWEKWVALAVATTAGQQLPEDIPPPVYTPKDTETAESSTAVSDEGLGGAVEGDRPVEVGRPSLASDIRPIGYNMGHVNIQDINAFGYQPSPKQTEKLRGKRECFSLMYLHHRQVYIDDKMLLIFWLPILFSMFAALFRVIVDD